MVVVYFAISSRSSGNIMEFELYQPLSTHNFEF